MDFTIHTSRFTAIVTAVSDKAKEWLHENCPRDAARGFYSIMKDYVPDTIEDLERLGFDVGESTRRR